MADGISQPGGAGTTIFFESDAHADADLDGVLDKYHPQDIVVKALASGDAINLGTNIPSYKFRASVQNGDGVGTATTTFELTNVRVMFDATKTYLVNATGRANRWTKFGTKVQGAAGKPSGKNGVVLDVSANTSITGNILIYGSLIRSTGVLTINPAATGLTSEVINTILEATGNVSLGSGGFPIQVAYNVDIVLNGSAVVLLLGIAAAERLTISAGPSSPYCFNTGTGGSVRFLILIGTPLTRDIRWNGAGGELDLIDVVWTGNAPQLEVIGTSYVNIWSSCYPVTRDGGDGSIVANVPVELLDREGAVVASGITDALGNLTFGVAPTDNAVKVRRLRFTGVLEDDDRGPFTWRVNYGPSALPAYLPSTKLFVWPYSDLPSGFGKQHLPLTDVLWMTRAGQSGAGMEDWRSALA